MVLRNEQHVLKGLTIHNIEKLSIGLPPIVKAYLCINCTYIGCSGKGALRCLTPSLLSPVEDWPVEGILEFWWDCNQQQQQQKNKFWLLVKFYGTSWKTEAQRPPQAGVDYSKKPDDERKAAADVMTGNVWRVHSWLTVGTAEFSWGLLLWLRGGFGELGGVREAHTRWSIWYSSCCRHQYS